MKKIAREKVDSFAEDEGCFYSSSEYLRSVERWLVLPFECGSSSFCICTTAMKDSFLKRTKDLLLLLEADLRASFSLSLEFAKDVMRTRSFFSV